MDVLYQLLGAFSSLPAWTRWIFVILSLAVVFGIGATMSPMVGLIVAIGLLLVVGLVFGFHYLLKRSREKKAAAFSENMNAANAGAPSAISDPARRAKLEDLRRSFQEGIEKFRGVGKNLYDLPWYAIVGEPGAGKTEAIRHSSIGFPPGMQDEYQGVGGTINMNWWFTDHAVILDTAGRLMFEEVPPGSTSEWREFLNLLKTHRPNCPINGLVLVLPAESLIKDTGEEITQKARRIATQLEVIQKQLDIRFPVYVLISKCDLLNGFREFFDDLHDEDASHQIAGWSNPDPLDQPFRPELVDAHIQTVAQRLTRRRLGLLVDPVPHELERRVDEVDRLFALPHSLALIGRNLQRYLQTLFTPGQWTSQPLFLRGIYFTSAMREGSALDQELAVAMGLSVDELPEGRAWERKRSYFLRDVFSAKAFLEKGLVTRASNTRKLVRKRRSIVFGVGAAALVALFTLSLLGFRGLRSTIGSQSGYWARAAEGWEGDTWNPIVVPDQPLFYRYTGNEPVGAGITPSTRRLFDSGNLTLTEFHVGLYELSLTPIKVPWAFRLISRIGVRVDEDRRRAQRIVFEDSVVAPAMAASRDRMGTLPPTARLPMDQARAEAGALLSLVRLEAGLVNRKDGKTVTNVSADDVLVPLVEYTATHMPDPPLARTMDALYLEGPAREQWPGLWVSGGSTLSRNKAIDYGLTRFIASARDTIGEQTTGFPLFLELVEDVRKYAEAENSLYSASKLNQPAEDVDRAVLGAFSKLQDQRQTLDAKIAMVREAGLFGNGPETLSAAYDRLLEGGRYKLETALAIEKSVNSILEAGAEKGAIGKAIEKAVGENPDRVLFREIKQKLQPALADLQTKIQNASFAADLNELRRLDEFFLEDAGGGRPHYLARWDLYDRAIHASPSLHYSDTLDLIGTEWKPLVEVNEKIERIRSEVESYHGKLSEKAITICQYSLTRARQLHARQFCKNYLAQAKEAVRKQVRFPIVWSLPLNALSPRELVDADALIGKIEADLQSPVLNELPREYTAPLSSFAAKLSVLDPIRKALLTPDRSLRFAKIVLLPRGRQFELSGQRIGTDDFKGIRLRAGTIAHGATVKFGTPGIESTNSASEKVLGQFTLQEPFHFHFHRSTGDSTIAVDMPAPESWTALLLPFEQRAVRSNDGRSWRVGLQPANDKLIWIEIRFDEPLPEFSEWPTLHSLGLDDKR